MLADAIPNSLHENELAARLKNDDRQAFNSIYWSYHSAVYFNVLRIVKDVAAAEDIVQEVFITLWEKRLSIDKTQSLPGWLFTVSHNKSINYLRKSLKVSVIELKDSLTVIDIAHGELQEERVLTLEKAIEQLSPQKKRVFELCKLQRKTYEEAAVEMNLSRHTVKEYLSGAMVSVTQYVKEHAEPSAVFTLLLFFQGIL